LAAVVECVDRAAAALAGLRVGYGAFPLEMMEYLWRAKQPYNVSAAAETAACAALTNPEYLQVRASWCCDWAGAVHALVL
jgi:histidinol-phosphate/aromatic aminotransferase/cobyric acid decarboxylase-like protein